MAENRGIYCLVSDDSKQSVNISPETMAVRRRPGRPRGLPKPEGSGRQPGTPNRVGKEARELAAKYTPMAFKRLGELAKHPDPKVAVLAIQQILDRRFGKPISPSEISGPDGAPLVPASPMTNFELANLVCFALANGVASEGVEMPRTAPARTIDTPPSDPFAAQRAEQAAEIAATQDIAVVPAEPAAMSDRERDLRELHAAPWRGGNDKPDFPKVVRFNPRHR